jgi:hypothetical protein
MQVRLMRETLVEVELVGLRRLPADERRRRGMNLTCDHCGCQIAESSFVGGFVAPGPGMRNLLLHETCIPQADKDRLGLAPLVPQ